MINLTDQNLKTGHNVRQQQPESYTVAVQQYLMFLLQTQN